MVVAYGTVKKGSIRFCTVVDQETIKDAPIVSFEQVLAVRLGVQAISISGQPGAVFLIRIRGWFI